MKLYLMHPDDYDVIKDRLKPSTIGGLSPCDALVERDQFGMVEKGHFWMLPVHEDAFKMPTLAPAINLDDVTMWVLRP